MLVSRHRGVLDNLILNRIARSMLGAEYRGGVRGIPGTGAAGTNGDRL